jgi:hypothetical protein
MNPKLLLGIAFFTLAAAITWFQLNGQFMWKTFKENIFLVTLLGIPISYCYIWATKYTVESMDGVMWPTRFIGFGIGVVVYAILVGIFFNEGITIKTSISLALSILLILIQIFYK